MLLVGPVVVECMADIVATCLAHIMLLSSDLLCMYLHTILIVVATAWAVLSQAPEDQKINYGLALLKGLFHNWLNAKYAEEEIEQQAAQPEAGDPQAALQPSGYASAVVNSGACSTCYYTLRFLADVFVLVPMRVLNIEH